MTDLQQNVNVGEKYPDTIDVVIVGAGFAGLFMLHRLRQQGLLARIFEAGGGIGGAWYWNSYPGARCDVESMEYSYSFCDELQQEWKWSERYASQSEILRYLNHVADRFDLHRDIQLESRVTAAIFDENLAHWKIQTDCGDRQSAKFLIMATGCLSVPKVPDIKGLDSFKGNYYHTGQWPHEDVNFAGRRVAIIGTGSSGIQLIPVIAEQAAHVFVFQRTPNFSIPSDNAPLTPKYEQWWKSNYNEHRRMAQETYFGVLPDHIKDCSTLNVTPEEELQEHEKPQHIEGFDFASSLDEILVDKEANHRASEFVRDHIRSIVKDPATAELLLPYDHPIATKRLCVDNHYFETYNRDNVTLVDLRNDCIDEIVPTGLQIKDKIYQVDYIVFATGFDAITGALLNIDICGRSGKMLREKWVHGPRTYLGIMIADFPNLFTICGPGSPSVLSNMVASIEQHVEWVAECLAYLRTHHFDTIEADVEAENMWVIHVKEVADRTLFAVANSWYTGSNIPGKPRTVMPYVGGFHVYRQKCKQAVLNNYETFRFKTHSLAPSTIIE